MPCELHFCNHEGFIVKLPVCSAVAAILNMGLVPKPQIKHNSKWGPSMENARQGHFV